MNGPKMGWDTGWKPGIQSIPAIAPGYKKQTYPKGAVISVGEKLYISNTAISTPEDFNKDHWDETDVMSCISDVSGDVKILYGSSNPGGTTYPDAEDVVDAVAHGKEVIIFWNSSGNLFVYRLEYMFGYALSGDDTYVFRCIEDYNHTKILSQVEGIYTWSWEIDNKIPYPSSIAVQYSDQSTYAEGDYCMYHGQLYVCTTAISSGEPWTSSHWAGTSVSEQIGNVEELLAAL
jgi:hypothetical protein